MSALEMKTRVNQGCQVWPQSGSDSPLMKQIPVLISQNILKSDLKKSPVFVPFSGNLTYFGVNSMIPDEGRLCGANLDVTDPQLPDLLVTAALCPFYTCPMKYAPRLDLYHGRLIWLQTGHIGAE